MFRSIILAILLVCSLSLTAFAQPPHPGYEPPRSHHPERHEKFSIDINFSRGGNVSPSGRIVVDRGETVDISIRPERGFSIARVIIDGRDVGPVRSYVFRDVNRHHTAYVEFVPERRPPQRPRF